MRTMIRTGLGAVTALATLGVLAAGSVAYAETPEVDVALCADVQAAITGGDTVLGDLPETVAAGVSTRLGAALDLGADTPLSLVVTELACDDATPEPTTSAPVPTPDAEPIPTAEPTTPSVPGRDLDCADLGPGEAERLLREDPTDPNRLDANRNGIPCELDDIVAEAPTANPTSSATPGSGSNSQFDAMPSTAPETGRA